MKGAHVACWPLTSFTALQKCGRYRINSGQTAPSGLTSSAAFDPLRKSSTTEARAATWPPSPAHLVRGEPSRCRQPASRGGASL